MMLLIGNLFQIQFMIKKSIDNNRCESSHEPSRVRERQMRRFESKAHAHRFFRMFSLVYNVFNLQRHFRHKGYKCREYTKLSDSNVYKSRAAKLLKTDTVTGDLLFLAQVTRLDDLSDKLNYCTAE